MLHGNRDHHRRERRTLRLVDADRVGQRDFVQFAEVVSHQSIVVPDGDLLVDRIDPLDRADVSVEDFLLLIVLCLNNLVPNLEPPPKPFGGRFAWPNRVQDVLERRI